MPHVPSESVSLIESLRSPAAYGHPVGEIRVLQTHISWVLLTGQFAYKIKKPVNMGFLDFTTLDRRRHFCQEELRLNRRLAPQLYLDVVPITGTAAAPRIGGMGEPIEYAVRMQEFPQGTLLSELLKRGRLTPAHVDALAQQVAEFHGRIARAAADGPWGTIESIKHSMEEVFDHLEIGEEQLDRVRQLRKWCENELTARCELFASRRHDGFVREGHGDLHLGNMLLLDGRPVVFDCIEFNDDFRWLDVLSDVAFTTMDFEDRGNPAYSHRFLNAYLEHTGDYTGLAVARYYMIYRAAVRAKVAALRLRQPDLPAEDQRRLLAEHDGYLALAESFASPQQPRMILTHGPSGCGKTTLTQPVIEAIGAVRIRSDIERKRMFQLQPLDQSKSGLTEGIYAPDATQQTYARLLKLAQAILDGGFSVIVDATFLMREQRMLFRRAAELLGAEFAILDFHASEATLRQRVEQRRMAGSDASEADLAVLATQLRTGEPLSDEELSWTIDVDSESPTAVSMAIKRLTTGLNP